MIADVPVSYIQNMTGTMLDPFAHLPHLASGIAGLGEAGEQGDAVYVFHTTYSSVQSRWARFEILFRELAVSEGILAVQVHILADIPGSQAALLKTESVVLSDLLAREGRFWIDFPIEDGNIYAAYGRLATPTDARASGLVILLQELKERPSVPNMSEASPFGRSSSRSVPRLVADRMPSLAFPLSQPCTKAQLREPTYHRWLEILHLDGVDIRTGWTSAFIMQTLTAYGMLEQGAYGLGLGVAGERLPASMAALGCRIVAAASPSANQTLDVERNAELLRNGLRFPDICANDVFNASVEYRIGPNQDVLTDSSFDFCWSTGLHPRFLEPRSDIAFFGESLRYVKPGGLVVHVFELGKNARSIRRPDIEKLALLLVSHGHLVAQLNFHGNDGRYGIAVDDRGEIPFGLILRRSPTS